MERTEDQKIVHDRQLEVERPKLVNNSYQLPESHWGMSGADTLQGYPP
jgi:hypothetical protein